jgi:hypothetical protein
LRDAVADRLRSIDTDRSGFRIFAGELDDWAGTKPAPRHRRIAAEQRSDEIRAAAGHAALPKATSWKPPVPPKNV